MNRYNTSGNKLQNNEHNLTGLSLILIKNLLHDCNIILDE